MKIGIESARQRDVEVLLRAGEEFARTLYSEEECFMLNTAELEKPGTLVWVARRQGFALGMAALVMSGEAPEVKRLFVSEAARGGGLASALLDAVEKHARDAAAPVIRLETGQLSVAAIALYKKRGYQPIPRFGGYVDSESSVCMELIL
ncbi:MAG: GNAT family N-acetyltransferase [Rhodoglobus sp.]